jgi:hypothetical protein
VTRNNFQIPTQQEELKLPISRYASNKKKSIAVNGTSKYRQCFCVNVSNKLKKKSFFEEPDTTFSFSFLNCCK